MKRKESYGALVRAMNLVEIIGFIARENPAAARRLKELIDAATSPLAEHPYLFRRSERRARAKW